MPSCEVTAIRVSCAIIEKSEKILAARRGPEMAMPLKWELPGGKIEAHESPQDCLKREIFEELNIQIRILDSLNHITYDYPDFTILLYPFICQIIKGKIQLAEHTAIRWLAPRDLKTLDWALADLLVIEAYCLGRENKNTKWKLKK